MQPPFKRAHPGSTPGQPTKIWAFGRTVMHLTLNQAEVGSTPTAPTNPYPCDAIGRRVRLKTGIFASNSFGDAARTSLAGGMAGIEHSSARQSHQLHTVSATLTPATNYAGVAQRQSNRLVSDGLQVRLLSPAPECESGAAASIPGFQPVNTSSSLVFRSEPLRFRLRS